MPPGTTVAYAVPGRTTLAGVIFLVQSILSALGGVVLLLLALVADSVLTRAGLKTVGDVLVILGVVDLAISAFCILTASMTMKGRPGWRIVAIVVESLNILFSVLSLVGMLGSSGTTTEPSDSGFGTTSQPHSVGSASIAIQVLWLALSILVVVLLATARPQPAVPSYLMGGYGQPGYGQPGYGQPAYAGGGFAAPSYEQPSGRGRHQASQAPAYAFADGDYRGATWMRLGLIAEPVAGALEVAAVHPTGVAGLLGVRPGDRLVAMSGVPMDTTYELEAAVLSAGGGASLDVAHVTFDVVRAGQPLLLRA
jgi:hypothetical protein